MIRDQDKLIQIPGELTSAAVGHIVTAAEDIFDYDREEYQSIINRELYNQIVGVVDYNAIPLDWINLVCI